MGFFALEPITSFMGHGDRQSTVTDQSLLICKNIMSIHYPYEASQRKLIIWKIYYTVTWYYAQFHLYLLISKSAVWYYLACLYRLIPAVSFKILSLQSVCELSGRNCKGPRYWCSITGNYYRPHPKDDSRLCFHRHLSVHIFGGVPHLAEGGMSSFLMGGGTPSQVRTGEYLRIPPVGTETGWGYPPPPVRRQSSTASTCYAVGGVPLAFHRRTFLLLNMAAQVTDNLCCTKHCGGVNEQNRIVKWDPCKWLDNRKNGHC